MALRNLFRGFRGSRLPWPFLLISSGRNLRFADPSFIRTQNLLPLVPLLFLIYHTHSELGRSALLIASLSGLLYGALNLKLKRFVSVLLVYVASYSTVFLVLSVYRPRTIHQDPGQWMIILAVAFFMLQMGLIGNYVSQLRARLAEHNRRIAELANHDDLTGGYNRRFLMDALASELTRARRGHDFSVCLMDIDHFKSVNDQYGHNVGDEVLRRCTATIRDIIREADIFGRYGGEEFLLIMPEARHGSAVAIAERLRLAIQNLVFESESHQFNVTISLGVAENRTGEPYTELLQRADRALYDAKHGGRNRVCV